MNNSDWVEQELTWHQKEELEAIKRVAKAQEDVIKAKAELAAAKECLAGVRGGIREFEFQLDYLNLHVRLP